MHERSRRHWRSVGLAAPWQIECLGWLSPGQGDPLMGWGVELLPGRVDMPASSTEPNHPFLDPLLAPERAWSEVGQLLLWLGLVSRDRDARGVAVDALIAGIDDGRADPERPAAVLTRLRGGDWVKVNRAASALQEAARVSPLHALTVVRLLEHHLIG
jgi:hypothetical protein